MLGPVVLGLHLGETVGEGGVAVAELAGVEHEVLVAGVALEPVDLEEAVLVAAPGLDQVGVVA